MTDKPPDADSKDDTHKTADQKVNPGAQSDHDKDQEHMHQTGTTNHETTKDPNDNVEDLRRGNKTPTAP